jgi:hypothetical protein
MAVFYAGFAALSLVCVVWIGRRQADAAEPALGARAA